MSSSAYNSDFEFFALNRERLEARYAGKVIVIRGRRVVRVYESEAVANRETQKEFPDGSFLIQKAPTAVEVRTLHPSWGRLV